MLRTNASTVLTSEGQDVPRDDVAATFGGAVDLDRIEKVVSD